MSASTSIDVSFDLRVAPILFGATTAPGSSFQTAGCTSMYSSISLPSGSRM